MKVHLKTKYADDYVELQVHPYDACRTAMAILAVDVETGEHVSKPTVYLTGVSEKLKDDEILLKDYSENEGMVKAFVDLALGQKVMEAANDMWIFRVTDTDLLAEIKEVRDRFK